MKFYSFGTSAGLTLCDHNSANVTLSRILKKIDGAEVSCAHLGANGLIGKHNAEKPQLFMVVSGYGWVCGKDGARTSIAPGAAAYWAAGEECGAGTSIGMTAVIIEADGLDPAEAMPELH